LDIDREKNDDRTTKQAQQWISQVHRSPGLPGMRSAERNVHRRFPADLEWDWASFNVPPNTL